MTPKATGHVSPGKTFCSVGSLVFFNLSTFVITVGFCTKSLNLAVWTGAGYMVVHGLSGSV